MWWLVLVGEAHDLVFDAGAIARAAALDLAGVHRGAVQVGADDLVDSLVGVRDVHGDLRERRCRTGPVVGQLGEGDGRVVVAGLLFEAGEVDGLAVEARRGAGLEAAELEAQSRQTAGEAAGGLLADAAAFGFLFAGVHEGAEEGAGGDDAAAAVEVAAVFERDAGERLRMMFGVWPFCSTVRKRSTIARDDGEVGTRSRRSRCTSAA